MEKMRLNANTTVTTLALLASGSTPWACESSVAADDHRFGIVAEVPQPLAAGDGVAADALEPLDEACGDTGIRLADAAHDGLDNQWIRDDGYWRHRSGVEEKSGGTQFDSKQPGATVAFVVPSTADYKLLTIGYTKAPHCGSAKVYFDNRYVETINLYAPSVLYQCERGYHLESHTAAAHRLEVQVEGKFEGGDDPYVCLDYIVADW
jgi:hypothetical protein